jgi:CAAX prenyl protease-like protein
VLFGVEHEQWLAGLVCGALYNGLLYRTKSLFDCVVAHATSNALLAAWVLSRGAFALW